MSLAHPGKIARGAEGLAMPKMKPMRGSTVMWALMASAPGLFLGFLAIAGRTQSPAYVFPEYSEQETRQIYAYREAVRSSALALEGEFSPTLLEAGLEAWTQGIESGALVDTLPIAMDDQGTFGVKSQILAIRQDFVSRVQVLANDYSREGRHDQAALTLAKITLASDAAKYSGTAAINLSGIGQLSALRVLRKEIPYLTQEQKEQTARILRGVRSPSQPFTGLAATFRRLDIEEEQKQGIGIGGPYRSRPTFLDLSNLEGDSLPPLERMQVLEKRYARTQIPRELVVSLSCAISTERKLHILLREVLEELGSPLPQTVASNKAASGGEDGKNKGV